jgi:BirA family transcriptional regulator, biotin operon repressor / biotin---[acetyl-CoA-carboxylase] ligase
MIIHKNNQIFRKTLMKTLFVGQNSIHLESIDSTNSYASEMLRQIAVSEGSVIYTFKQLNGRGQRGNIWESEPNSNVALSVILYPKFLPPEKQFLLTKTVSLAVADVMSEILGNGGESNKISIKWPNDIYVNDRKIAGILIENTLRESMIQSSVVGIGININQLHFNSAANAVSLANLSGKESDLTVVMERLLEFVEARYLRLKANKTESIDAEYLERLYKRNEWSTYISAGETFEGKITGVSESGRLQVELRNAGSKEFDLKEISFSAI